ncbi:MAG: endonuclease V [Candidatus Omnitrophica bacterium]|nr:endonuclease V [Candidatus Omnitrophota bacterium]
MRFKDLHPWDVSIERAIELQESLREKIKLKPYLKRPTLIAGADAYFREECIFAAVVVVRYPEEKIVEKAIKIKPINFPYIPGLFSFREGPVLLECFRDLNTVPQIVIFDGQGIAHPRRMGLATHLGIILDLPTIGCAKSYLYGYFKFPQKRRSSYSYLYDENKNKLGVVLTTKDKTRPLFVSPGHKMDILTAKRIILMCTAKFRIPQPLRLAHQEAVSKSKESVL